jgi:hypothetical protein
MRSRVFTQPGSKAALTTPQSNFRFIPESGLNSDIAPRPFRARNGYQMFALRLDEGQQGGCSGRSSRMHRARPPLAPGFWLPWSLGR